jgi:hypothetical protein
LGLVSAQVVVFVSILGMVLGEAQAQAQVLQVLGEAQA